MVGEPEHSGAIASDTSWSKGSLKAATGVNRMADASRAKKRAKHHEVAQKVEVAMKLNDKDLRPNKNGGLASPPPDSLTNTIAV